ncbi:MAG: dihydroorotate dehydrogenase electron transfer subunit [Promethearchaeota archaeon]
MCKNKLKTVKIEHVVEECKNVKTITVSLEPINDNYIQPRPGQFVMVWVPGIDEIPISLSHYDSKGNWSITVKNVGECTKALLDLNIGDYIGIRGPFGKGFELPPEKRKDVYIIAGGIGLAPLRPLILELKENQYPFKLVIGTKTKDDMIFKEFCKNFPEDDVSNFYCTDDGSYALKGLASDIFTEILKEYPEERIKNILVYTCGPEKMMFKIFKTCERYGIPIQASLERIMRCGCGLCGLCVLDPLGLLTCTDGPVFDSEILRKIDDFGRFKRDFTGKKVLI